MRGNLPFGYVETGTETYVSSNGCKIGTCADPVLRRGGQRCFEPPDYLKGDIARSFFYLSTAYSEEMSCCDEVGVMGGDLKDWMESTMREWHAHDGVDDMERRRNNMIYAQYQHNRNPFIDHPEWVEQISNF
jgi:endonuclease I